MTECLRRKRNENETKTISTNHRRERKRNLASCLILSPVIGRYRFRFVFVSFSFRFRRRLRHFVIKIFDLGLVLPTGYTIVLIRLSSGAREGYIATENCRSESLIDLWCSSTANLPAHIVGSAMQGAFPDPLALSANMSQCRPDSGVSDSPTGLFTVCSGRQDRTQIDDPKVEFRSGRVLKHK